MVTDILGNEIYIDDAVCYGTGQGAMRFGIVSDIKVKQIEEFEWDNVSRKRVSKGWVDQYKLKVRVYSGGTWASNKNVTIHHFNSIVKITGDDGDRLVREYIKEQDERVLTP